MKREEIYNKFDGKCAYTGKNLGNDCQIDHIIPKSYKLQKNDNITNHNDISNLVPTISIVNHYKRGYNLEQFRNYMLSFHQRLAKLPKKTKVETTKKRIIYMNTIADLFGITTDKAFDGLFYFEKICKED